MALDASEAASRKIDGPAGFFLALELDESVFFALRRMPGTVLEVVLSDQAVQQLLAAGMVRQPIPGGFSATFTGEELVIPPEAFDTFNQLRSAGKIQIFPARTP